jgi:hypothetical protein
MSSFLTKELLIIFWFSSSLELELALLESLASSSSSALLFSSAALL